ncbi:MAG: hypothetical protein K8T25_07065 [Planctomycetia bacterium]|nr:hypothetical protein [Planctomycetia bacterium]
MAFLICTGQDLNIRYFKAGAVVLGFMSHLVLDEIWSIDLRRGLPRLKKSSGTAMKFWGESGWANFVTYGLVLLLSFVVSQDPNWMGKIETNVKKHRHTPDVAVEAAQKLWR